MPIMSRPRGPAQVMEGRGAFATWQWQSGWVPFGVLWNSTGQPAASVPAGFSSTGCRWPSSSSARRGPRRTLLTLAGQIEAARSWVPHRPPAFDC